MYILLVEDDTSLGDALCVGLNQQKHTVDWFQDGASAQAAILSTTFDVIILDLGLPKLSGLDVLKNIRKKQIQTPVLILTASDTIDSRIEGLDRGADDFLSKPFDLGELCARLRAIQRRSQDRAEALIKYKDIILNPAAYSVTQGGDIVDLSRREFALLQKLLESTGRVISRDQLTQTLYGWDDDVESNALEVHIHNLRKKFDTDLIKTIRGVGYTILEEEES